MKINKSDFIYGIFFNCLISEGVSNIRFDKCNNTKIIRYRAKQIDHIVFIKDYRLTINQQTSKVYKRSDVGFTKNEIKTINDMKAHLKSNEELSIVIVLPNANYTDTEILIMSYDELKQCIHMDNKSDAQKMSVRVLSGSNVFRCFEYNGDINKAIRIGRDYREYI